MFPGLINAITPATTNNTPNSADSQPRDGATAAIANCCRAKSRNMTPMSTPTAVTDTWSNCSTTSPITVQAIPATRNAHYHWPRPAATDAVTTRGVARCSIPCSIPSPPSVLQPPAGRCAGATGNEILRRSLRRQPKRIHPWRPRISPTAKGCIPCGAAEMREGSAVGNKRATDGTESSRTPDESQPAIEPNPEPRRAPPHSRRGLRNRRSRFESCRARSQRLRKRLQTRLSGLTYSGLNRASTRFGPRGRRSRRGRPSGTAPASSRRTSSRCSRCGRRRSRRSRWWQPCRRS